jgi:hypothetical protein
MPGGGLSGAKWVPAQDPPGFPTVPSAGQAKLCRGLGGWRGLERESVLDPGSAA